MATSLKLSYNKAVKIAETSQFAMRHILIFFVCFTVCFGLNATSAAAEDQSAAIFEFANVGVDVTAKNAAQARDAAIIEAQHMAFTQLMGRLGAPANFGHSLTDNDIATLVQSFEVQNEHSSSVRYIGSFSVRFKPNAVRRLLSNSHVAFTETRSRPYVVLPIYSGSGHSILWEENTRWRMAWKASPPENGVVPIIVPAGGNDDVAVIATSDTITNKTSSVHDMIDKYQAEGAVIALLRTNIDSPSKSFQIDLQRFSNDGTPQEVEHIDISNPDSKGMTDALMTQMVMRVRDQLDKDWRANPSPSDASISTDTTSPQDQVDPNANPDETMAQTNARVGAPTAHLTVAVAITSLAEWTVVKRKLAGIPLIVQTNIITLQRGATMIDLEFRGTIPQLQQAVGQQNLLLTLGSNGIWTLQRSSVDTY